MTDLTDRMRTTAAAIRAGQGWEALALPAAADLLVEAADALDGLIVSLPPQGEPMEIIPPVVAPPIPQEDPSVWIAPGGSLPGLKTSGTISRRHCPNCDSRAYKTVRRVSCVMMITCQVCGHEWQIS